MGVSLDKVETGLLGKAEIEIPHSSEAFQPPLISMTASSKPGELVLMVMAVQYLVNKNGVVELQNDKRKMPCGVIWTGFFDNAGISVCIFKSATISFSLAKLQSIIYFGSN